jgi:hypothetical protein
MKKILALLSLWCISCTTLNKVTVPHEALNYSNFTQLNGRYSAKPDSTGQPNLADFLLVNYYLDHISYNVGDSLEVELKAKDNKHLEVKVFRNQTLESKEIIRGKLKNNHFVLSRQAHLETDCFGFLNVPTWQKTRLRLQDETLIIDAEVAWYPCFIILPFMFVKNDHYGMKFKKLTN